MLKTNTKAARANIRAYIVDNFAPYDYDTNAETFPEIAAFILDCFRSQKYSTVEDRAYYHCNDYMAFLDWAAGLPSVLDTCYYYNRSAVDDLGAILEETDEEKARYTESVAEETLTRLIYSELLKGAQEVK